MKEIMEKQKNNLIIGLSQLSHFFPDDYVRVSSRNIDFDYLKNNRWDSVYITFAEQRVNNENVDCIIPNYSYTIEIIDNLVNNSNKIVVYTTCELWNKCSGIISLKTPFNWSWPNKNGYCFSKEMLSKHVYTQRGFGNWNNVIIIYPFNFNSTYRRPEFLFFKIFDSIINKKKIEIGDTYFFRDIIHAKYVVERSIKATNDEMVGSGCLYLVNDYIRDLYKSFDMKYEYYVTENLDTKARHTNKEYYSEQSEIYTYDMLLLDTINDIKQRMKENK
jgi:nucleoside-diphosphate-sugar epimerase